MRVYLVLLYSLCSISSAYSACGDSAFARVVNRFINSGAAPQSAKVVKPISAVRKQKLSAYYARDEFNITTTYEMLPQVKMDKLNQVEKFRPSSGTNENWFYRGEYKGQNVFIKTLDDVEDRYSEKHMLNEARHYYLLDMLGLGPKFHGVAKVNGKMGVVLEHVEGVLVKWGNHPELRRQGIKIHQSALRDIRLAGSRLDQAGIHDAKDMQFIISPDGRKATLVDPEHFSTRGPDNGARKSAEELIETLKGYIVD